MFNWFKKTKGEEKIELYKTIVQRNVDNPISAVAFNVAFNKIKDKIDKEFQKKYPEIPPTPSVDTMKEFNNLMLGEGENINGGGE